MDISRIFGQNQAIAAQLYGAQTGLAGAGINAGGVNPKTSEKGAVGGVGFENEGSSKFNWRNLSRFDNFLTTSTPQTGVGRTNETPVKDISAVNIFGIPGAEHKEGLPIQRTETPQNSLTASLNALDAKDIGLNGDRSGFEGQKKLNLMA